MGITVCIVDDNKDIRSALEQIIIMYDGYRLLGSFSSAEEAIENIPALAPQVVLMDINLGGMSGIECVPADCLDRARCDYASQDCHSRRLASAAGWRNRLGHGVRL